MVDVTIVNETSPEANWNWQAGRQTGGQTNLCIGRLRLQKSGCPFCEKVNKDFSQYLSNKFVQNNPIKVDKQTNSKVTDFKQTVDP